MTKAERLWEAEEYVREFYNTTDDDIIEEHIHFAEFILKKEEKKNDRHKKMARRAKS